VITIPGYTIKDTRVDSKNHIIVRMDYHDALVNSMKKLAAIEDFLRTRAYVVIMETKKRAVIDNELKPALAQALSKAEVTFQGKTLKIREDIGIITDVPAEIFNQIKQKLLNEQFTKEYPEYPKLKSRVSAENIRGTMESVLKDIMLKQGVVENLLTASGNILIPLGLYKGSRLDVAESQYAKVIMDKIEDTGKNVSIQELVKFFEGKPYGIHEELVYLILAVLLRNGDIMFSSKRGNTYSASDSNALFQNGLKAYDELSYVKKEEELNVSQVQMLFNALSEDISLLHAKKDRPEAYRRYIEKIEQIEKNIKDISADFERLKESVDIGIPTEQLNEQIAKLRDIDFSRLKIKSIVEFKKLDYSTEKIRLYREGYESIKRLKGFFDDYFEFIKDGVSYMKNAVELTQAEYFKKADAEKLSQIYNGAKEIIQTTKKLLKEDERRPLKGKVEEFKKKYKEIYYHTHNSIVGNQVDWQALYDIEHSETVAKMSLLKDIKCINPAKYTGTLLRVKTVEDTKCTEFKVDELDTNTSCPHCQFPAGDFEVNINSEIPKLGNEFEMILQSWEHQIIDEMRSNQDNVSNLDHDEKRLIQDILSKGYIPKELGEETITAINNLLEGLEVKEVDLVELQKILTEDADVLKVDEFREKIERYIEGILESGDTGNIRLRIKGLREK